VTSWSVRRRASGDFFIHPPNERKRDRDERFAILDRVEAGVIPAVQSGSVDLCVDLGEWLAPKRHERLVN
jgi:hypothetical protein